MAYLQMDIILRRKIILSTFFAVFLFVQKMTFTEFASDSDSCGKGSSFIQPQKFEETVIHKDNYVQILTEILLI